MAEDQEPADAGSEPTVPSSLFRAFREKYGPAPESPAEPASSPSSRTSLSPEDRRERAALGGHARARKLVKAERRKIAKKGQRARMRTLRLRKVASPAAVAGVLAMETEKLRESEARLERARKP